MSQSSKIFVSNRALGYVSNQVPLVVRYIQSRKENLVVTCVGKSFHTYGCSRFTLLSVSGLHPDDITCLAADTYHIFTSSDCVIRAWRRGTELKHSYIGHTRQVHLLLPFGPHLVSVDEDSNLKIWDIKAEELYLELTFDNSLFEITTILHPSTYLNKILLGSEQGRMQLWNIHTSKLVHTFQGWNSSITVLEQAPAVDIVAVGLANGRIIIHNIKFDKIVMEFVQDWGLVSSLAFRTDGHPILASGSLMGHIVFWDLEEKKVASQLLSAHTGSVTGMKCLPNEPLIVTSSPDNTLKMWIFDMVDGEARLLRYREGHSAPPSHICFHGHNGHNILSSGGDSSLRIFSTQTETFNKSLGHASYNRKASKKKGRAVEDTLRMPPILNFVSEPTREKEWDNIAAIHVGLPLVTTWSYDKVRMGNLKLLPERFDTRKNKTVTQAVAASLCLTKCGNFVVIGYSTGHVDRFNLQSGIHRETYGQPTAHKGAVRGVTTDALNKLVVTGGNDTSLKFWPFKSPKCNPLTVLSLEEPVAFFCTHKDSSIIAVALEDFTITVVDLDTRNIIRKFQGHTNQLTDAAFSPDSRWLITAAMDCTIRTWDIPSGQLVDCFQVDAACTSLSFSPTGDLLATTHVNYLGIFLWSNRTLYSHVSLRPLTKSADFPLITLPLSMDDNIKGSIEVNEYIDSKEETFKSLDQINEDLITLSTIANSRWQNLLDIDIVKKRNKPKNPPKAPKAAPFFLVTVPSLQVQFDLSEAVGSTTNEAAFSNAFNSLSVFGKLLNEAKDSYKFQLAFNKLKSLGPSAIDVEITSLTPEGGGSIKLMLTFLQLIEYVLTSNYDFELAQAYLGLFLKKHGDMIMDNKPLQECIQKIQNFHLVGWANLQDIFLLNMSIVHALKTI